MLKEKHLADVIGNAATRPKSFGSQPEKLKKYYSRLPLYIR